MPANIFFNLQNHPTFHSEESRRKRVLCWSMCIISLRFQGLEPVALHILMRGLQQWRWVSLTATFLYMMSQCFTKFSSHTFAHNRWTKLAVKCYALEQCCGSGMIYSGSRSSLEFSAFRIQPILFKHHWNKKTHHKFNQRDQFTKLSAIFYFIVQSYSTQSPEFTGLKFKIKYLFI